MGAPRWQDDRQFVAWLLASDYLPKRADGGHDTKAAAYLSAGTLLYMWEAWRAGARV